MNVTRTRTLALLAVAGAATGIAQAGTTCTTGSVPATGPTVIHVSGATLQETFLRSAAATNDYIDVDGDGDARSIPNVTTIDRLSNPTQFPPSGVGSATTWNSNLVWGVAYSAVGSGTGFQELVDFGDEWVTTTGETSSHLRLSRRTAAYFNGEKYVTNGVVEGDGNANNPAGSPVRAVTTTSPEGVFYSALFTSPGVTGVPSTGGNEGLCNTLVGGMSVDVAPLDVPTSYFAIITGGSPLFNHAPLAPGYGSNPFLNPDKDGTNTSSGARINTLTALGSGANLLGQLGTTSITCGPNTINRPIANSGTIFDTPTAHAPVAAMANFGIGHTQIEMSELRHLSVAGRMTSGENLTFVARQSGSGTRAAWATALGLDPSFAKGDGVGINNTGQRSGGVTNEYDLPGAQWLPANKNGSGNVDNTVINCRTCLGHSGAERGDGSWLTLGRAEVLGVQNDVPYGGTQYSRPTVSELLHNNADGYIITGPASFATYGDPKSAPENLGGFGWMEPWVDTNGNTIPDVGEYNDINNNGVRDAVEPRLACERPTLYPAMRNQQAAAFINNITRSIDAFVNLPGDDSTFYTPGELLATQFVLLGATDNVQQAAPVSPTTLVTNPAFNLALQNFTVANSIYNKHAYQAYGNATRSATASTPGATAGKVPNRIVAAGIYSDAALVPAGDKYALQDASYAAFGNTGTPGFLTYTSNLPLRNLIAGDFNADGLRNVNDAAEMIKAWRQRTGGPAWVSPAATGELLSLATTLAAQGASYNADVDPRAASIEILGDFNNDGSFNAFDLRFWADGFALATSGVNSGNLDRKAGFTALDNALSAATAGADNNVFNTTLATGKVYAAGDARGDIANALGLKTPGFQPIGADGYTGTALSAAQKNVIDAFDIDYIYRQFKTNYNPAITGGEANWDVIAEAVSFDLSADVTGDLIVNQADVTELVTVILGTEMGDVNLDGIVNAVDEAIINASIATPPATPSWANGDLNGDGVVNTADLDLVAPACPADFNGDNTRDVADLFAYINAWLAKTSNADFNNSGNVDVADLFAYINSWLAGC